MENKPANLTRFANIFLTYYVGFSLLFVGLSLVTKVAIPGIAIALAFISAFLTNIWFLKSHNRTYSKQETISLTNQCFIRLFIVTTLLLAYNIYLYSKLETSLANGFQSFLKLMPPSFYIVHIVVLLLSYVAIYLGLSLIAKQATDPQQNG